MSPGISKFYKLCRWFPHMVGLGTSKLHCLHVLTLPCSLVPCNLAAAPLTHLKLFLHTRHLLVDKSSEYVSLLILFSIWHHWPFPHAEPVPCRESLASLVPFLYLPFYLSGLPCHSLWWLLFFSSVLEYWWCEGSILSSHLLTHTHVHSSQVVSFITLASIMMT